ncbi:MAG: sugar kinase [Candidatus Rokuibacteriota bacterium]|nr:MAG: sugar kinase [Candidatus Rokubacteria bacterium]
MRRASAARLPSRSTPRGRPSCSSSTSLERSTAQDAASRPRPDAVITPHDLVTLGEVLLRLSIPSPGRFETARQLDVQIGGAEANVAATCARLGLRTALISALPANAWGDRVRRELASHGLDCAGVRMREDARLGVYFLEYAAPPRPIRVLYDRPLRRARLVHLSGITPALGDAPRALFRRALGEAELVSFDVNYRAKLWKPDEARDLMLGVLPQVRYLFVGADEARTIFGLEGEAAAVLSGLTRLAPKATVTLMQGEAGSTVADRARLYRPAPRHTVQVVDPIGAGDAYVAGFLWAVLQKRPLQDAVDIAATVAALKCSLWGDIALINAQDVDDALGGSLAVRR